jgi:hypothetical protein
MAVLSERIFSTKTVRGNVGTNSTLYWFPQRRQGVLGTFSIQANLFSKEGMVIPAHAVSHLPYFN